jgi:hypothetical protein
MDSVRPFLLGYSISGIHGGDLGALADFDAPHAVIRSNFDLNPTLACRILFQERQKILG